MIHALHICHAQNISGVVAVAVVVCVCLSCGQVDKSRQNVSGVFPHLAMVADHTPRSESGIGAVVPWADGLWAITYVAHKKGTGSGTGLFFIDENLELRRHPESVVGTFANRMVHGQSDQLIIGPHFIDTLGNVRTARDLLSYRLTATMEHLTDPDNKVYFLGMEGEFLEVNVHTLEVAELYDLKQVLALPEGTHPHFKGGFTYADRVVVANNTYDYRDYEGQWRGGRLAEWDGSAWTIIEDKPFTEVWGAKQFKANFMVALGWDKKSAIIKMFKEGTWKTYRLPKSSISFDNHSATEWMRIRSVESERALLDCHGILYELPYQAFDASLWGIRPICNHLRIIPDYCSWRGMLVMAGNQATPMAFSPGKPDLDFTAGQPQAGLWFGKTDDLWSWGKPAGWGGVWWEDSVVSDEPSDPFLMTGFDKKSVHITNHSDHAATVSIEIDYLGNGSWNTLSAIELPAGEYRYYAFKDGFSAHWLRLVPDRAGVLTSFMFYN